MAIVPAMSARVGSVLDRLGVGLVAARDETRALRSSGDMLGGLSSVSTAEAVSSLRASEARLESARLRMERLAASVRKLREAGAGRADLAVRVEDYHSAREEVRRLMWELQVQREALGLVRDAAHASFDLPPMLDRRGRPVGGDTRQG